MHKEPDVHGDPRSRPIVQASSCLTSRPGELIADVLEGALAAFPISTECQSTEEMLARVDEATKEVEENGKNICVGSGDVTALYPSLEHNTSARLCSELILTTPASFSNIDSRAAGIFVATNCSSLEISRDKLGKLIPRRKFKMGIHPTNKTKEITTRLTDSQDSKFFELGRELTELEVRRLVAKVVEISVKIVVKNHLYMWKNEVWRQTGGVPTGLRLSSIIGRITMDSWMSKVKNLMAENQFTSFLMEKYVDDVDHVMENIPVGSRWTGTCIEVTPETVKDDLDAGRSREEITMKAWGEMASMITPGIKFTVDYPANHASGRVPVLDFELWKEMKDDPKNPGSSIETILYSFYEKPVTNSRVMDRESAVPHRMMIATMVQEGVRRLLNCCMQLPSREKCMVLSTYMRKLQKSHYSQALREEILACAVRTYRKKERAHALGIRPLHRRNGFNAAARRRAKISGKANWFRPKSDTWKTQLDAAEAKANAKNSPPPTRQDKSTSQCKSNSNTSQKCHKIQTKFNSPQGGGVNGNDKQHSKYGQQKPADVIPNQARIESVMFVPHTPGGELARQLQKVEDSFSSMHNIGRVKIVERGGRRLKDILGKKDPWAPASCLRSDCMMCQSASKKKDSVKTCHKESVVYLISCDRCKINKVKAHYVGESSRTGYLRGKEHYQGQQSQREENALCKHDWAHHQGAVGSYSMELLRKHHKSHEQTDS